MSEPSFVATVAAMGMLTVMVLVWLIYGREKKR